MQEFMYGDETVKVFEAIRYDDIHYWGVKAKIEFKGETYSLFGSSFYSGNILWRNFIAKCDFNRLYCEEQNEIDETEWDYFENVIRILLGNFIDSCAKESWETYADIYFNTHILIDGVEVEQEEEA